VNTQFGSFDSPFFASSWKGVQAAVGAGFASDDSRFQEGPSIDDSVRTITTFVQEDCSLIVTVGALLVDVTEQFAIDNPEILFVAVDAIYDDPPPNLRAVHFRVDEAAFLAGYLAAGTTRSGVVGTFGGYDIPEVTDFMDGFLWGVQHFNEVNATSVRVVGWDSSGSGAFIGNFEIAADGRLMTETLIADGADIVFPVAGLAGLGSTEAARAAGDVAVIGVDTDAFYADPAGADLYLTSVMKNLDVGVFDAIADAAVGTLDNVPFIGTLDNGGVNISPLHAFEGAVPANLPADLEVLKLGIINGEVSMGPVDRVALTWIHNPATDHYYSLTGIGLSWEELETLAQEHGGYLVSIGDVAEEEWVYSYFGSTVVWIGLTDRAVEGEWMWTSGEPATYLNWCPGEPSDAGGGSGPEDAAYAIPSSQCWNDEGVWVTEFLVVEDGTLIPSYPGVIELDGPPD
jgi:basic membrane protein A